MAETKLSYNRAVTLKLTLKASFPVVTVGKESAYQCRRHKRCGFYRWVDKIPGVGNGKPFQYCLENSTDKGGWQVTGRGVPKSQTRRSN